MDVVDLVVAVIAFIVGLLAIICFFILCSNVSHIKKSMQRLVEIKEKESIKRF